MRSETPVPAEYCSAQIARILASPHDPSPWHAAMHTAGVFGCRQQRHKGKLPRPWSHSDRTGLDDSAPAKSWNSSHKTRGGCTIEAFNGTGGDGLFYCFAAN